MDPLNESYEIIDKKFQQWLENRDGTNVITEGMQTSRYSVEVNYRTDLQEVLDNFAKITLGYVSAAMKNCGYHCKVVFNKKPYRVLVSTRNWDDGEWVGIACFNHDKKCFIVAEGSYNRDRKTVSISKSRECSGSTAADLVKDLRNMMERLKKETPRGSQTLQPVELKRGPKPSHLKKLNKTVSPWKPKKAI